MRRDYFELDVENIDWVENGGDPKKPLVRIAFHGPKDVLERRLSDPDGTYLDASETDVAFRLQDPLDEPGAAGVVSVTNRITGDFVLELNESADDVLTFIRAAREYGRDTADSEDGRYRVEVSIDGENVVVYEKQTFLVYDADGNLLRSHSLIPSGVEL
ncbi:MULTISPECIES: DUF5793 family protein [Halobellus]|jgi:hypothetical protein|uniref:DUF5793 family protein n=1 Tax=Halobellus TaxID=1073986 RepID=UPI000EF1D943|nr:MULTISPECIES: DUF5793 family protein [Halobellus]MDQ2053135.1 DUF5793 family protein [Halobellus sp. H-GB7]RLM90090.1 hypothetical protein D3D02_04725 [Halobellus sp. Atlit-38R]